MCASFSNHHKKFLISFKHTHTHINYFLYSHKNVKLKTLHVLRTCHKIQWKFYATVLFVNDLCYKPLTVSND